MDGMARLGGSPAVTSGTGYPWQDGDILYADDLNAAFIPILGGIVSIPVTFSGAVVFTAGVSFTGLPISDAGLSSGALWNNGGFICIKS